MSFKIYFKVLFLLSFSVSKILASYGGHDLFTSLAQVHGLWENEQNFVSMLEKLDLHVEDELRDAKERYIQSYTNLKLSQTPNFDFIGHPLNGYFLVKHVALAFQHIFKVAKKFNETYPELLNPIFQREENEMLPSQSDINGAAFGVARLHSLYGLDSDRLAYEGVISTNFDSKDVLSLPSASNLSSWDLLVLGGSSSTNGLYNTMIDMYQRAIRLHGIEVETTKYFDDIFDDQRMNATQIEKLYANAVIVHDQTLEKRGSRPGQAKTHPLPVDMKLRKKKKYHKKTSEAYVPLRYGKKINQEKDVPDNDYKTNYQKEMLCTGKTFRTPEETKDLYCFYGHNSSPWLRLGPIRVEIQSFSPYIAVLRNLMFEHECDDITRFLTPKLNFPPGRMKGRGAANDWTMKNSWPVEDDNVALEKMTRRVEHIMNILAASNKDQSDKFMCGNYGIGGHYGVHPDFYDYNLMAFADPHSNINRISTVMTVLEAPEAGGATVWPFVGVYVMPEKGSAVAWYNTLEDAQVDEDTKHAACPVLLGQKWIGNKWIAYKANWEKKRCGLKHTTRLMGPLK